MQIVRRALLFLVPFVVSPVLAGAEEQNFPPLDVPARSVPVPDTVSPQMRRLIGAPLPAYWKTVPRSADEWKSLRDAGAARTLKELPKLREQFGVRVDSFLPASQGHERRS